jgi:hypothetical protein
VRGDHLARYQPPRESFVQMGGHKRQIASGMIGLYRPLRTRQPHEDPKAWAQRLTDAKLGHIEPHELLQRNTMGVVQMKSRHYGDEWHRVMLRVEQGAVIDPAESQSIEDRYDI